MALTAPQKKLVEQIIGRITAYLDIRFQQVRRFNPKMEAGWEDIQWNMISQLRVSLSNEKMFGPVRFNVAELLTGDDLKKRQELFLRKSQNCLLSEIVESKESGEGHKTAGAMEIHDMRTLCYTIDSTLEHVVALVQTFIWWDLEDACDLIRFERKAGLIKAFEENGITPEMADYYRELMQADHKPTAEEVILYECKQMKKALELFRTRRAGEQAYMAVVKRELGAQDNPDMLIEALAGQQNMLKQLRSGGTLSEQHIENFAKAMGVEPGLVSPEKAAVFLETMIVNNRKRLRNALNGTGSGAPVNVKQQQLEECDKRFLEVLKDRKLEEGGQG